MVVFSEIMPTRYGSCVRLKLDFREYPGAIDEVRWQNIPPAFIKVEDHIGGF